MRGRVRSYDLVNMIKKMLGESPFITSGEVHAAHPEYGLRAIVEALEALEAQGLAESLATDAETQWSQPDVAS